MIGSGRPEAAGGFSEEGGQWGQSGVTQLRVGGARCGGTSSIAPVLR